MTAAPELPPVRPVAAYWNVRPIDPQADGVNVEGVRIDIYTSEGQKSFFLGPDDAKTLAANLSKEASKSSSGLWLPSGAQAPAQPVPGPRMTPPARRSRERRRHA